MDYFPELRQVALGSHYWVSQDGAVFVMLKGGKLRALEVPAKAGAVGEKGERVWKLGDGKFLTLKPEDVPGWGTKFKVEELLRGEYRRLPRNPNYLVSRSGTVCRVLKSGRIKAARIRRFATGKPYTWINPGGFQVSVASLVAETWLGAQLPLHKVIHRDGDVLNCHVDNLEVVDNLVSSKRLKKEERERIIDRYGKGEPATTIAKEENVTLNTVYNVVRGKNNRRKMACKDSLDE